MKLSSFLILMFFNFCLYGQTEKLKVDTTNKYSLFDLKGEIKVKHPVAVFQEFLSTIRETEKNNQIPEFLFEDNFDEIYPWKTSHSEYKMSEVLIDSIVDVNTVLRLKQYCNEHNLKEGEVCKYIFKTKNSSGGG